MSNIPRTALGVMKRVLTQEMDAIPPSLLTRAERLEHLFSAVKGRKDDLTIEGSSVVGLTINSIDDLHFIGAGAVAAAHEALPDKDLPEQLELVIRSAENLMFPARLPAAQWELVRGYMTKPITSTHERIELDPKLLCMTIDGSTQQPVMMYSSGALNEMDSRIDMTGQLSCPAFGIILERSFAQFIDVIYSPNVPS